MDGDMIILEHGLQTSLIVPNWDCGTSAAFDITVTSPLNSHTMLEASMYQGVSAKAAEHRKHNKNDPKCAELGWRCVPLTVENYGVWGPEALKAFSQVASRLAIRGNTPKSKVVAELYGRLSLLLIRANAQSISTGQLSVHVFVCVCFMCYYNYYV